MRSAPKPVRAAVPCRDKRAKSLRDAIEKSGLRDGMTISFHHHLRNGDAVIPMVLAELEAMGFKNLTFAPSSIPDAHDCVKAIIATIPIQLLAYYIAVQRGCDVDKPRNLAKAVTVE